MSVSVDIIILGNKSHISRLETTHSNSQSTILYYVIPYVMKRVEDMSKTLSYHFDMLARLKSI